MLELVRWVHVIGATVLLGTGGGIAFFMLMAHRTRDAVLIAHTGRVVVIADWIFTASAVILQPITGLWLAAQIGWPLSEPWLVLSIALYILTGLFWLPVVRIQTLIRDIAREAAYNKTPLPARYDRLFRIWFFSGFPAFFAVLAILWLMINRPALW